MTRKQKQAQYAAEHRHMRDRLLAIYAGADAEMREAGRLWYPSAEGVIASLADSHGIGRPRVAGIVAVLSPQQKWRINVRSARAILDGEDWRVGGYEQNRQKAKLLLEGAPVLAVLGGDKVTSFWANLIGSRTAVTIDVWAQRAALGRHHPHQPKGARYKRLTRAYRAAAEAVGELPREFQAICWLATRPAAEHDRDWRLIHHGATAS